MWEETHNLCTKQCVPNARIFFYDQYFAAFYIGRTIGSVIIRKNKGHRKLVT